MAGSLNGRVAFITGADRLQGRSHAVRLAQEGADIIAFGSVLEASGDSADPTAAHGGLKETARQIEQRGRRVIVTAVDSHDYDALHTALESAVKRFGRLDIACTDAGHTYQAAPSGDLADDLTHDVIDADLSAAWNAVKAAIPYIRAGGRGGCIILTSTAEHGVTGLVRTLARELSSDDIRVNTIRPTHARPLAAGDPAGVDLGTCDQAMTADAVPEPSPCADVSNTLAYLVSDEASSINGTTVPVDAGHLA